MQFKLNELKKLIALLKESEISKLEYKNSDFEIKLDLKQDQTIYHSSPPIEFQQQVPNQVQNRENTTEKIQDIQDTPAKNENIDYIKSPMVGTFYAAQSPESPNYVSIGQKVKKGDVVCIIEAMKLMNEITSEYDGVITEIFLDNASTVEFDTVLYAIEKQ